VKFAIIAIIFNALGSKDPRAKKGFKTDKKSCMEKAKDRVVSRINQRSLGSEQR